MCGNQLLDVFLHHLWRQLWWVLTNLINFLILLLPLGVYLFHPWPICNALLLSGMAFVILVQRFLYLLSVLSEVWFQWRFHLVHWESYSFSNSVSLVSIFCLNLWQGGLKVSGSAFSAVILSVEILCIVGASGISVYCGISSMVGSRRPMYSLLLNVICLLV